MGQIFACDLCKSSVKQASCSQVTISKKGKEVKVLDSCPSCTKTILSGNLHKSSRPTFSEDTILRESFSPSKAGNYGQSLTNIDPDENDKLLEEKLGPGVLNIPSQAQHGEKIKTRSPIETNQGKCPHYSKKRLGDIDNPYFQCRECGEELTFPKR